MIYGYARVSTKKQQSKGNSLEDQTAQLIANGCEQIFHDTYTGTKIDRPEFTRLLSLLKPGDTLVVTKLDRFARSATDGAKQIKELLSKDINVYVLNMGKADNTPMGKLMIQIMFAFAEFERDMIVERTQSGREYKRETDPDYREGRHPVGLDTDNPIFMDYLAGKLTATKCYTALGMKKTTFYARLKEMG